MTPHARHCLLPLLPLLALSGCQPAGDRPPPTTSGSPIISSAVQSVILEELGGGFIMLPPPDVPCGPYVIKYTLTLASRTVTYAGCFPTGATYETRTGSATLDDAAWAPIESALGKLEVADGTCVADVGAARLTVSTDKYTQVYQDSFNGCGKPGIYVDTDSANALGGALYAIANP